MSFDAHSLNSVMKAITQDDIQAMGQQIFMQLQQQRGYHKHDGWQAHPVRVKDHQTYFSSSAKAVKPQTAKKKPEYYDDINNLNNLKKLMARIGKKDDKVRTVNVIFGRAYVKTYNSPGAISYHDIGDSPMSAKGFWKNGKMFSFPEKLQIKYQNSAYTADR